jgi:hypothetical protein
VEFTANGQPSEIDLSWTAGLMSGDGCFTNNPRPNGSRYFIVALAMKDRRSVMRAGQTFADIVETYVHPKSYSLRPVRMHAQLHSKGGMFYRLWLGGPRAENIAQALLPFLGDNDKADQLVSALAAPDTV